MPLDTYVTVTSEANSYGITQDRWFDGKSEIGKVQRDVILNWQFVNQLTITKIDEIFNLDQTCSDDSYYQCLAKRFTRFDFKQGGDVFVNGSKCSFDKLCAPFSLPFDDVTKFLYAQMKLTIAATDLSSVRNWNQIKPHIARNHVM